MKTHHSTEFSLAKKDSRKENDSLENDSLEKALQPSAPWARLSKWCSAHMSEFVYMIILAVITGVVVGAMAHIFKKMIRAVAHLFLPHITSSGPNWWIIAIPIAGILLTGIFTRYVVHENLTHVVAQLINDLKNKTYRLRHALTFSAVLGGTITLGMGGSSGAEGPIAATGAAIGSNIGQLLGLDKERIKLLLACGASAGIAGIFSAPIGGLMFSLELLRVSLTTIPILAVTVAALTGYLTSYACNGFQSDLFFHPEAGFEWATLPAVICLGICCGFYSLYYTGITNMMDKVYKSITNLWVRNIVGGVILGGILFMFPSMFGVGYPILGSVLAGHFDSISIGSIFGSSAGMSAGSLMLIAGGILFCKSWAVSATNSSGGVGGDFAPTLFAGGVAGFLFATFCNQYCGTHLPIALFAYYGMAATMSGIIRAPLMSIFIVIEMSISYSLSLPVSVAAIVSYLTVKGGALTEASALPLVKHLNWIK